ncbi:PSPA7_2676 family Cys-rich small protein [Pseudomonas leptonychotis]
MTFLCFWFGCKWGEGLRFINNGEQLVQHQCVRCGTCKVEADD